VNNIDLDAARERGIVVCNTPDVLTDATADLTMTLLLALARRVREGERIVRSGAFGAFRPDFLLGRELKGTTLGLFGFGRIGQAVARRANAFGMRVLFTTRHELPIAGKLGASRVPFEELLRESDVLSIHAPLTAETRHVMNEAAFATLKRGAFLLNTSRGPLVDEAALVRALESGSLGGAGLDVYENEPEVHPRLVARDDVVLLPHVGSATQETRAAMASLALRNCFAVIAGNPPIAPVR
jgi:glyoxylate reductase